MKRVELSARSYLLVDEDFIRLTPEEFQELIDLKPEERGHVVVYGKKLEIPRFQKLFGKASYRFSGVEVKPEVLSSPVLIKVLERIKEIDEHPNRYNGMLVNWYPDGSSYIGPHSDDEKDLVPGAPIYSISFGATRTFRFHRRGGGPKVLDVSLTNGTLVAMCGDTQKEFKHSVPVEKKVKDMRINITVRAFNAK